MLRLTIPIHVHMQSHNETINAACVCTAIALALAILCLWVQKLGGRTSRAAGGRRQAHQNMQMEVLCGSSPQEALIRLVVCLFLEAEACVDEELAKLIVVLGLDLKAHKDQCRVAAIIAVIEQRHVPALVQALQEP